MGTDTDSTTLLIHASCVAWTTDGVLITGASGRGKSSLALTLMAYGCTLVADDRTILTAAQGQLSAKAPDQIKGMIEARGVGLLPANTVNNANLTMVVDLDSTEHTRLPLQRSVTYLGVSLPVYYVSDNASFPAAILQLLKTGGRRV